MMETAIPLKSWTQTVALWTDSFLTISNIQQTSMRVKKQLCSNMPIVHNSSTNAKSAFPSKNHTANVFVPNAQNQMASALSRPRKVQIPSLFVFLNVQLDSITPWMSALISVLWILPSRFDFRMPSAPIAFKTAYLGTQRTFYAAARLKFFSRKHNSCSTTVSLKSFFFWSCQRGKLFQSPGLPQALRHRQPHHMGGQQVIIAGIHNGVCVSPMGLSLFMGMGVALVAVVVIVLHKFQAQKE